MSAPERRDMIRVQGNKEYLPVPARVQWMRGEHADWGIDTAVIKIDWEIGYAVMRAEVRDETGRIIGAGTKTETRKGFGDFVEKAETGAVGRALARAGYGTEDALDLEGERYADAPIEQQERGEREASTGKREQPARTSAPASSKTFTNRGQIQAAIAEAAHERGYNINWVDNKAKDLGIKRGSASMEELLVLLAAVEGRDDATDTSAAARAADQDGIPLPSEELSDASGIVPDPAGAPPVPPELQERIDKARSRGKKADEPVQDSLLGEPVA